MDDESIKLYKRALQDGREKVHNIRVMVVGQYGVGKTALTKRLLGRKVDISEWKSTEGIDVYKHCCKISLGTGEWIVQDEDSEKLFRLQRLMNILPEPHHNPYVRQEEEDPREDIRQRKTIFDKDVTYNSDTAANPGSDQKDQLTSVQPSELSFPLNKAESRENQKTKDAVVEILQLINENSDKLEKDAVRYAALSIWDFAGQYAFYTTHQTFLTSRAMYLLVIDLNQQVTDLIEDDMCYLDMVGRKMCKVQEMVEIWLNSIHTCAPSHNSSIPNVILVGTHVDQLAEKSRKENIDDYFHKLHYILKDQPTICHLKSNFVIDNTQQDPMLDELKRNIFELASDQPHWGEEIPARWLPLEQAIITLKDSGAKVVARSFIEEINRSGSVRIEDRDELDLFLRFHHEMGIVLYFSVEGLKEKIVLDPQWLIDALKSLITAETFIKKYPAITSKWYEFKETGKLTHELIDAIWTKKNNQVFHDNKDHLLLLMEKLNIIAKPRSFTEDGKEVKEEDYYLVPCMLQQATPIKVIYPELNPEMESTYVICFVCTGNFLPPPVFHRLLGACLTCWPIAKQKSENLIYCGCCAFKPDPQHKLILYFRDYVIFAQVTRLKDADMSYSVKLCSEARNFILENLTTIIGNLGQSLQFEQRVRCPYVDVDSLEGMFAVSLLQKYKTLLCHSHDKSHALTSRELLKFWFNDKEHIDDGCHKAQDVPGNQARKQLVTAATSTQIEHGIRKDSVEQIYSRASDFTASKEHQLLVPSGKKYHAFFSYASPVMQWVKHTVAILEKEHGFVCCEYDRDNTPGTPLLKFAEDGIRNAHKTVVVMTKEAFESGFVQHEIQMALIQVFDKKRNCVVPVLLKDCQVPDHLRILNYVDVRNPNQRGIWWQKLLTELQTQEDDTPEALERNQGTGHLGEERSTKVEQEDIKEDRPLQQLYITTESGTWV